MMLPSSLSSTLSCALPCHKNGFPYNLSILEQAPVLVWHAGPDSKCDWFNASWLAFTGRSLDQELGDGWTNGVHPEDLDAGVRSFLGAFKERRSFEVEYRLRHHSGEYRWIHVVGNPLYSANGEFFGYIGYCFDVMDRKRAEHALVENEERWQFALEGSQDGVWDWNVQAHEAYFSPRWKEMLGYEPDEIGTSSTEWFNRVHPDDLPKAMEALQKHFSRETPFYLCEHRLRAKDGSCRLILARGKVMTWTPDGKPLRMLGTHIDMTELKQLKEFLIESQVQFSQAFVHAPIGMALAAIDGRWLKVNPALCAILKYSEQELLTLKFQNLTHPDDMANDVAQILRLLSGDIKVYQTENRYLAKDGDVVWVQLNVSLVCDARGRPVYFIKQMQDITNRIRAESALKKSKAQLRALLEERERMARDLHDNSIQALYAVGMDLCECKDLLATRSGKQKVGLVLYRLVDRINEVIRELRGHILNNGTVHGRISEDVAQKIRQIVRQVSESRNIRIKATVHRRAITALDHEQVAHVLAIMREGLSNIVRHAQARRVQVALVLTPPAVCLEIADDGVGGVVFQNRQPGRQQGLRNIRSRAVRMKAEYTFTSPQGGGTRIRILIPNPRARGYGA